MSKKRKNREKKNKSKESEDESNSNIYIDVIGYVVIVLLALLLAAHLSVVVSGSMEPSFYRGDIVVTENVEIYGMNIQEFNPYTDVQIGDVVVYDAKWYSEPVIHRVIDIKEVNGSKYYIIKGDNNDVQDPYPVSPEQVRSKVVKVGDSLAIIPKIGYVTLFFRGL